MNSGQAISRSLIRAKLSVSDFNMRMMALDILNEIVQEHWSAKKYSFRVSRFNFNTAVATEEYALHKYADVIVPFTVRGTDPVRIIQYNYMADFFKNHPFELSSGDPYWYREGEHFGVEKQPSASSTVTAVSSVANLDTGTVNVIYGSRRMELSAQDLTIDDIGKWIKVGSDWKRFQIVSLEPNGVGSSKIFNVHDAYDGVTDGTASFVIGDVQQKVNIQGIDDQGAVIEEDLQLNGSSSITGSKSFASLMRITKSDRTHGRVTCTSNGGIVTNIILDPGETEADFKTIKLYKIPDKVERIEYETYTKHPILYRSYDAPLFPGQWHQMFSIELFIRVMTEFVGKDVSLETLRRRDKLVEDLLIRTNDSDEWHVTQEHEGETLRHTNNNLPAKFDVNNWD